MKQRKLFALLAAVLFLTVFLSGCIKIPLPKYYEIPREEVAAVQFYDLRDCDSTERGFHKTVDPVYTLPEEEVADFLEDFAKIEFTDTIVILFAAAEPSVHYGEWVVRINFTDGSYTFYSSAGYGETLDADGNQIDLTHYGCDADQLAELINNYYPAA